MITILVHGKEEVLRNLESRRNSIAPANREMVADIGGELTAYARGITHRFTGTLADSHFAAYYRKQGEEQGVISISPTAKSASGSFAANYGPYEHDRGGTHAFYSRTVDERGSYASERGMNLVVRRVVGT